MLTPFEQDILDQPQALRRFTEMALPDSLGNVRLDAYDRVVITGMGSSHFAGLGTWRALVDAGTAVWWVPTAQLLEVPNLITDRTLLLLTSQSGASGEIVALLEELQRGDVSPAIVAVTNDEDSPLAQASRVVIGIHAGEEATVSTKTYVNSLAAHARLRVGLVGGNQDALSRVLLDAAAALETFESHRLQSAAAATARARMPRVAVVGAGAHGATALLGGLTIKEATKVPAEGFIGGEFRHGPLELAGDGLTALFFGIGVGDRDGSLARLAADVAATGATVVTLGDRPTPGGNPITIKRRSEFSQLVIGALACQRFSVELAKARGVTPGEFLFGSKVTAL